MIARSRYVLALLTSAPFVGCHSASAVPAGPQGYSPPVQHYYLVCSKHDCRTPYARLVCDTYDKRLRALTYEVPKGWHISRARGVTVAGHGTHDVTVTQSNATSLKCQWHCRGSHIRFGAGAWVGGYCEAIGTPPS
jgi:hypothetical protein